MCLGLIFLFTAAFGTGHGSAPFGCAGRECGCSDANTDDAYSEAMNHFDRYCKQLTQQKGTGVIIDMYREACGYMDTSVYMVYKAESKLKTYDYNNCTATYEFTNRMLCLLTFMALDVRGAISSGNTWEDWTTEIDSTILERNVRSICTYRYQSAQCILARMMKQTLPLGEQTECSIQEL